MASAFAEPLGRTKWVDLKVMKRNDVVKLRQGGTNRLKMGQTNWSDCELGQGWVDYLQNIQNESLAIKSDFSQSSSVQVNPTDLKMSDFDDLT